MSPYIVTTKRRGYMGLGLVRSPRVVSRRAVATLEEAQDLVREAGATVAAAVITESGGTITLPDGTVIEVEQTTVEAIANEVVPAAGHFWTAADVPKILDAYNARQA
jgi:hypothetical protein